MKKFTSPLVMLAGMCLSITAHSQVPVKPAHVVLVIEENYAYSEVIGSSYAPTLTALSKASTTVNFTKDYALTHPSEPNYLCLFSGSQQGVTGDETGPDANAPFNDCNLGGSLINAGYTFIGYAESQPSVGWYTSNSGNYYTKHCPWINWMYGTVDTVPVLSDQPFSSFPDSNHYSTLPTFAWVTPNIVDDMHNPSGVPSIAIPNGDTWFNTNIMPLVRWASNPANNTLVIVTWDEDDGTKGNNIALLFCGGLVKGGNNSTKLNHFDVLKTIEDMYKLPECDSSSAGIDVPSSIWKVTTETQTIAQPSQNITVWPVPAKNELNITVSSENEVRSVVGLYDITGRMVKTVNADLKAGSNYMVINTEDVSSGIYFVRVQGNGINVTRKVVISK